MWLTKLARPKLQKHTAYSHCYQQKIPFAAIAAVKGIPEWTLLYCNSLCIQGLRYKHLSDWPRVGSKPTDKHGIVSAEVTCSSTYCQESGRGNFGPTLTSIVRNGTSLCVLVIYCCVTNHPTTWQLETINMCYLTQFLRVADKMLPRVMV